MPPKDTMGYLWEAFLIKEWNSFHLIGKELDYLHLEEFINHECESFLKQP
jgi:hypothetical protein